MPTKGKVRVQLDYDPEIIKRINTTVAEGGVGTRKEFFDNALALLFWAVEETRQGRAIHSVSTEGEEKRKELVMPLLTNLKK